MNIFGSFKRLSLFAPDSNEIAKEIEVFLKLSMPKNFIEKIGSYIDFNQNYRKIVCKTEDELIFKLFDKKNDLYDCYNTFYVSLHSLPQGNTGHI